MIKKLTLKMFVLIQQCFEYIMKTYEKVSMNPKCPKAFSKDYNQSL
jgi:hypothetical protein